MGFKDWFTKGRNADNTGFGSTELPGQDVLSGEAKDDGIFKAYIPNFLYKPPFGMPRRVNTPQLKMLAKNPYVFSVIKTLCDEATSVGWEIKTKEGFAIEDGAQKDKKINGKENDDEVDGAQNENDIGEAVDYTDDIKRVTQFFNNPNGNEESFNHLLRQVVTDICEVDSGVFIKVFNREGEFKQLFARDGSLFLKNPDIYGYIGDRRDFVAPLPDGFSGVAMDVGGTPTVTQQQIMKQYALLYKEDAAYFQYGWTAGSMPVPFGKREVCYIMQNPRGDSIYGRSPIEVLMNTILNLIYGIDFNLDYYTNNNMPSGAIQLLGAQQAQIKQFRENFDNNFRFTDEFDKPRKKFFKFPISSSEVKFTPFQLNAQEMDILAQQQWFTKVLWMAFGVNADEMGFTESSNRAVGEEQIKTFKRKAIKPLLDVIAYHINTQIMPEFFAKKVSGEVGELPKFGEVPIEFTFDMYDIEEDMKDLTKFKMEIDMGLKTPEMVAKERGINLDELEESKAKQMDKQKDLFDQGLDKDGKPIPVAEESPEPKENVAEKPSDEEKKPKKDDKIKEKAMSPLSDIDNHINALGDEIVKRLESLNDEEFKYTN